MQISRIIGNGLVLGAMALTATVAKADYVGNPIVSGGDVDGEPPLVILGQYNEENNSPVSTVTFGSAGTVNDVQFYGGNYDFTLYALAPGDLTGGVRTFTVVAAETFSGLATSGPQLLAVSGFSVMAGDLLAFAGTGPTYASAFDATGSDATYADAATMPGFTATPPSTTIGSTFTVAASGTAASYDYINDYFGNQGRAYAIGVDYTPVPLPASAWLLLGGIGVIGLFSRKYR